MTETPLTINRSGRPEHTPEAELAVVRAEGELVVIELDDGESLELDRAELVAALQLPQAA